MGLIPGEQRDVWIRGYTLYSTLGCEYFHLHCQVCRHLLLVNLAGAGSKSNDKPGSRVIRIGFGLNTSFVLRGYFPRYIETKA